MNFKIGIILYDIKDTRKDVLRSDKSTAKQALNNPVLKNVKAIKEDKVYNLDPKLWYFAAGSTTTTIKQIEELEKVVK